MAPEELRQWQAYERVEPWGARRQDVRHGRLLAAMANIHLERKPGEPLFRGEDFYPDPARPLLRADSSTRKAVRRAAEVPRTKLGNPVMTTGHLHSFMQIFMAANNGRQAGKPG